MELAGGYDLQASKESIWDALNSRDRLQRIISGCTSVEQVGENTFKAEIVTRVGPLKVKFAGKLTIRILCRLTASKLMARAKVVLPVLPRVRSRSK